MADTAQADTVSQTGGQGGAHPFSPYEFMLAFRYLRAKRKHGGVALIASISFAGITLAVLGLIAVMSIMNGFRSELFNQLLGFQPHVYVDTRLIPADDVDGLVREIEALPGVHSADPVVQGQVMATSDRYETFLQVLGTRPEDLARMDVILNQTPTSATGLTHGDLSEFGAGNHGGDTIVLGSGVARRLGVNVGDAVTFTSARAAPTVFGARPQQKRYYVGAILAAGVSTIDDSVAFMPLEQGRLFFVREGGTDLIHVRLDDPDLAVDFLDPIRQLAGYNATVYDYTQLNPAFFNALQFERTAMRLILTIVVAIAAMNIISGLVMLVKNKSRDIAILRTMGASQAAVLRVFLIVGAAIGLSGTAAGIILGILFVVNIGPIQDFITWATGAQVWDPSVYYLYRIPAKLDWGEVGFISVFGLIVSLLVTLPPALRASGLDPVEALRYE
ncbi:lipoprotein-releasing ABC transporter permease subunit [Maricaulis parjimensis]|uniref:lipoprotein-releasing ABC transporter permease subunit n=1 Tax=Maricaulis parjimensis TaxID=144023 RepID=UPI001939F315|nr:lipoprotein-releasing ABC transporter permease subunit [Maricaulis parjimensis]